MELTLKDISSRLSLDIIDNIFKTRSNSNDCVKSVKVTKAAPAGEGLISAVYRIHVTGSVHKASFVAKGLTSDIQLRRTLRCHKFFEREIVFFSEILPQFMLLQKSLGCKENIQRNIPICYSYYLGHNDDYLVLEDLSETFCKSVAKPTKKNRDAILKVLAHLHAVSIALRIHRPRVFYNLVNKITDDIYYNDDNRQWYAKYLQNAIEIDKQALKDYECESSVYYKKFLETVNIDVYEQLVNIVSSYSGKHLVMNHGDAWLPNFMYSEERAVAIDFQLFRCTSPVADLTYYLALCSNHCPTKEAYNEAINMYYNHLEYHLSDMKLNAKMALPREDLDEELIKYGRFGLLAALTSIPLLASDRSDVGLLNRDKFEGLDRIPLEELWKLNPITDEYDKKTLVNALRVAVDVGLI